MSLKIQTTDIKIIKSTSSKTSTKRYPLSEDKNSKRKKTARTIINLVQRPKVVGTVFVFGTGDTGQLGLGDEMLERKKPMPLTAFDNEEIVDVFCGGLHSIALTKEGKLWSWGCNDEGALGRAGDEYIPKRVENMENVRIVKVACCDSLTMALSEDGQLYCWGTFRNAEGRLGFSHNKDIQKIPTIFAPLAKFAIADIAAGADHCLALTRNGKIFVWGNGQQSQLGRRVLERHLTNGLNPELLNLKNIKLIGAGSYHSFAVTEDNTLYAWGLNNFQQCGLVDKEDNEPADNFITKPTVITSLQGKGAIKSVQVGQHHTLVLMENGTVYAFGRADSGQLGFPNKLIENIEIHVKESDASAFKKAVGVPTQIPDFENIEQITVGTNHAIAIDSTGIAFTWGFGESSALGNGTYNDEPVPVPLTGQKIEGHRIIRASAGAQHSMILATRQQ